MQPEDKFPTLMTHRLSEQVYDHLKTAILQGRFSPGERLIPEDLAAHFQVSMTPVRDALKQLESDGLVKIVARRGVFITEVSAQDVVDLFQIRQIVESAAVEHLDHVPPAILRRLREIVSEMEAMQDADHYQDYARYAQLDAEFHRQIVALLENEQLSRLYEGLRWPIQLVLVLSQAQQQRAIETLTEHKAILTAMAECSPIQARQAIVQHLRNARDDLLRRLPEKP